MGSIKPLRPQRVDSQIITAMLEMGFTGEQARGIAGAVLEIVGQSENVDRNSDAANANYEPGVLRNQKIRERIQHYARRNVRKTYEEIASEVDASARRSSTGKTFRSM